MARRSESVSSSEERDRKKKKKDKRKRDRSPSEDRETKKAKKRAAKEKAKKEAKLAAMTPEEREARRKQKKMQTTAEKFGYTNESNPFGDSNLDEQFTWKKKAEKLGELSQPSKADQRQIQRKNVEEIEKVRKRRAEREAEMEEMERLRAEESRLSELQKYGDWMKKEEDFHLEQAKMRSKIRLVEGREKPIDVLAKNVLLFGEEEEDKEIGIKYKGKTNLDLSHLEIELREPYELFYGLTRVQLKDLLTDIADYQELEASGSNKDFFESLGVVCKEELRKADARAGSEDADEARVHKSVLDGVHRQLENLSLQALAQTKEDIGAKLELGSSDRGAVDVEYYEMVLRVVDVYIAKAKLHDLHQAMLRRQLKKLEDARMELRKRREEARARGEAEGDAEGEGEEGGKEAGADAEAAKKEADESDTARAMFVNEARKGMEDLEDAFDLKDEVDLSGTKYSWSDKYRPRKPRFFNRVKTGYDWNKYNQAHYDHDNPPPKTVQGYKFNIFYPDLLDRTVAPKFFLEKAAGSDDFAILRFSAGPPYEDLAFQIMNREWEISKKKGFKSSFDRGVMTLCFNFKRARYRR